MIGILWPVGVLRQHIVKVAFVLGCPLVHPPGKPRGDPQGPAHNDQEQDQKNKRCGCLADMAPESSSISKK